MSIASVIHNDELVKRAWFRLNPELYIFLRVHRGIQLIISHLSTGTSIPSRWQVHLEEGCDYDDYISSSVEKTVNRL